MDLRDPLRPGLISAVRALAGGLIATLALSLLRLRLAAQVGLGDDEAYYWAWSRRLDLSYFDHPGGVAWAIAAAIAVVGEGSLGVRLPSVLCGLLVALPMAALSAALAQEQGRPVGPALLWALLLLQACPLFALAWVFAAPDALLLLAWAGAMALAAAALQLDRPRLWLGAGLLCGLGLEAKHTAVLLVLGLGLGLGCSAVGRRQLRGPWPWLGGALALVCWLPVLVWNGQHGFISAAFHLRGRPGGAPGFWAGEATLLGGMLLLLGPAAAPLVAGLGQGLRQRSLGGLAGALALPTVLLFAAAAPWIRPQAHWLAPAALVAVPWAAGWCQQRPRLGAVLVAGSALLTALLHLQALSGILPLPAAADPTVDTLGWEEVGADLEALRATSDRPDRTRILAGRYQLASQAAYALRHSDAVVSRVGGRPDQFDLWRQFAGDEGWDSILVETDRYPLGQAQNLGGGCQPAGGRTVTRRGRPLRRFSYWRCPGAQAPK